MMLRTAFTPTYGVSKYDSLGHFRLWPMPCDGLPSDYGEYRINRRAGCYEWVRGGAKNGAILPFRVAEAEWE